MDGALTLIVTRVAGACRATKHFHKAIFMVRILDSGFQQFFESLALPRIPNSGFWNGFRAWRVFLTKQFFMVRILDSGFHAKIDFTHSRAVPS